MIRKSRVRQIKLLEKYYNQKQALINPSAAPSTPRARRGKAKPVRITSHSDLFTHGYPFIHGMTTKFKIFTKLTRLESWMYMGQFSTFQFNQLLKAVHEKDYDYFNHNYDPLLARQIKDFMGLAIHGDYYLDLIDKGPGKSYFLQSSIINGVQRERCKELAGTGDHWVVNEKIMGDLHILPAPGPEMGIHKRWNMQQFRFRRIDLGIYTQSKLVLREKASGDIILPPGYTKSQEEYIDQWEAHIVRLEKDIGVKRHAGPEMYFLTDIDTIRNGNGLFDHKPIAYHTLTEEDLHDIWDYFQV